MVEYFIAYQREVTDTETMQTYTAGVVEPVEKYGGKFVVRGGDPEVMEGDWRGSVAVIDRQLEPLAAADSWSPAGDVTATIQKFASSVP